MAPWIKYLPFMYEDMSSDIKNKASTSMERCEAERGKSPEAHQLASLAQTATKRSSNKAEGENSSLRLSAELHMRMVAQHLHSHTEISRNWLILKATNKQ